MVRLIFHNGFFEESGLSEFKIGDDDVELKKDCSSSDKK